MQKLKKFYAKRAEYIKNHFSEGIDFTPVFDPYIDEKSANPIMIIGEAPGANEVKQGAPFVGKAGENLSYLISLSSLDRKKDFLITNAFPFRTYKDSKNRTPSAKELKAASSLLKEEIDIVKPRLILLLGNSAIKAFSYLYPQVKELKKCGVYDVEGLRVGVCFHPSPLAFNRKEINKALKNFFISLKDS
ncbi:MAG: uracil-DNA glycosylase [Epsilonproteobacteria bacterium]|nr:uracil-DNA glycosylase [Campylobacterota bacterium]